MDRAIVNREAWFSLPITRNLCHNKFPVIRNKAFFYQMIAGIITVQQR